MNGRVGRVEIQADGHGQGSERTGIGGQWGLRERLLLLETPADLIDETLEPLLGGGRSERLVSELQQRGIHLVDTGIAPVVAFDEGPDDLMDSGGYLRLIRRDRGVCTCMP